MSQGGKQPELLRQRHDVLPAVARSLPFPEADAQALEGDDPSGHPVERAIHLAHAPASELVDELVPRADEAGPGTTDRGDGRHTGGTAEIRHPMRASRPVPAPASRPAAP